MKKCRLLLAFLCLGFAFEALGSGGGGRKENAYEKTLREKREAKAAAEAKADAEAAKHKRGGGGGGGSAIADGVKRLNKLSDAALDTLEEHYSKEDSYKIMKDAVGLCLRGRGLNVKDAVACARKQEGVITTDIREAIRFLKLADEGNIIGLSVKAVPQMVGRMFWKVGTEIAAEDQEFDLKTVHLVVQAMNIKTVQPVMNDAVVQVAEVKPATDANVFTVRVLEGENNHEFQGIKNLAALKKEIISKIAPDFILTYFGEGSEYYGNAITTEEECLACLRDGGPFSVQKLFKINIVNNDQQSENYTLMVKDVYDLRWQFHMRVNIFVKDLNTSANKKVAEEKISQGFFKGLTYELYLPEILNGKQYLISFNSYEDLKKHNPRHLNDLLFSGKKVFVQWGQDGLFESLIQEFNFGRGGAAAPANLGGGAPAAPIQQAQAVQGGSAVSASVRPTLGAAPAQAQPAVQGGSAASASASVRPTSGAAPAVARSGNPADDLQRLHQMLNELNQQAQAL